MGLLEKLKALINVEINSPLISINVTKDSHNSGGSRNHKIIKTPDGQRVTIYSNLLTQEQKALLSQIFDDYTDQGKFLMESESADLLSDIKETEQSEAVKTGKKTLAFFKDLIPTTDYLILEASVYLRVQFLEGKDIKQYKYDLRNRFGARGSNIINLYTAGYFEEYLIPLHNSSPDRFQQLYELMVEKAGIALFVHGGMSVQDICSDIESRVIQAKKYGTGFFHVHGRGQKNISAIKKAINKLEELNVTSKNIHTSRSYGGIIWVEILL